MNKICTICQGEGKYKCPTCLIYYCSVACCKKHREGNCEISAPPKEPEKPIPRDDEELARASSSYVDQEKLALLSQSEELKNILANKHMRNLLKEIDSSKNPESMMEKAMQEPLFLEFADACLKVVEPTPKDDNT